MITLHWLVRISSFQKIKLLSFRPSEILGRYSKKVFFTSDFRLNPAIESLKTIISVSFSERVFLSLIASNLFMSASTLRRKLKTEGNNIQDIRNRARLGYGLHLLQTTQFHIGNIAEQCGYQSQSRFTEQFKLLFGMTPREIRKTKMLD